MSTISIEEARAKLDELIHSLSPGKEVIITENTHPVAKLVAVEKPRRELSAQAGSVLYMAPDFDEPLEDFEEPVA